MNATQEKMIRASMERIDKLVSQPPEAVHWGNYVECPHCWQRQQQLKGVRRGGIAICLLCGEQYIKP